MEIALKKFPNGLPTLEELKKSNGSDPYPETAWIWGEDDEVDIDNPSSVLASLTKYTDRTHQPPDTGTHPLCTELRA
jgi:hypothetical protein